MERERLVQGFGHPSRVGGNGSGELICVFSSPDDLVPLRAIASRHRSQESIDESDPTLIGDANRAGELARGIDGRMVGDPHREQLMHPEPHDVHDVRVGIGPGAGGNLGGDKIVKAQPPQGAVREVCGESGVPAGQAVALKDGRPLQIRVDIVPANGRQQFEGGAPRIVDRDLGVTLHVSAHLDSHEPNRRQPLSSCLWPAPRRGR